MFDFIRNSLGTKTILLVSCISIMVFTTLIAVSTYHQKETMMQDMETSINRTSELIRLSVEKPMVVGDDAKTRKEFAFLGSKFPDTAIHLTNYKGNITYSTQTAVERTDLTHVITAPKFQKASEEALAKDTQHSLIVRSGETTNFIHVTSIPNRKSCYHCHGKSEPILGEMVVVTDISPTIAAINFQIFETVAMSLVGLAVLIGAVIFFIRRSIIQPVQTIAAASNEITQGNLHADFSITNSDELGRLAGNLGQMVGKLKTELGFSQGILDGMTAPYVVVDTQGQLTNSNEAMLAITGLNGPWEQYKGMDIATFIFADSSRKTSTSKVLSSQKAILNVEVNMTNRKGSLLHIQADAVPIYDLDENLIGAFTLCTDLTEIRNHEQLVQQQNAKITQAAHAAGQISDQVSSASEELSAQVEQSSAGAEQQRNLTGESASAMTQMNASVLEVAQNASLAAESATQAQEHAQKGAHVVHAAVEKITNVAHRAETLKEDMAELGHKAEGIGSIIGVINDIADQTNLLALNAAIEAARAGEAGRGFAVVADEVRKLAEKTMSATREVSDYISSIQESARQSAAATDDTVTLIYESTELASQSGETLNAIVNMVETTTDQVHSIATASEEQSAASEEISSSMEQISTISSETAEAMLQSSEAISDLARLAQELNTIIDNMSES